MHLESGGGGFGGRNNVVNTQDQQVNPMQGINNNSINVLSTPRQLLTRGMINHYAF